MEKNDFELTPVITIYRPCDKEWIDERSVEIENIEEDLYGEDIVTYRCTLCDKLHQSNRRG